MIIPTKEKKSPSGMSLRGDVTATRPGMSKADTTTRLAKLRELMTEYKVDAYIVPSADAHGSEWVTKDDERRAFISGFTGEAATALITASDALLFADSRFYEQAERQLDDNWSLQRVGEPGFKSWEDFVATSFYDGTRVGIDPTLIPYASVLSLQSKMSTSGVALVSVATNLVDLVWRDDRPAPDLNPVFIQGLEYAGESSQSKIARLRRYISSHPAGASVYLISELPSIAWLLNLRGSDIPFNPLFKAYCLATAPPSSSSANGEALPEPRVILFVPFGQVVHSKLRKYLDEIGVETKDYKDVWETLNSWPWKQTKCLCPSDIAWALASSVGTCNLELVPQCPVIAWKAIKNHIEIEGFRRCYLRDAVAFARWSAWMEHFMKKGGKITEWEAADRLQKLREGLDNFVGLSYGNITATGPNAALPHYEPTQDEAAIIDRKTPYLNDTGGQYRDGTTDTTRTMHYAKRPSKEHRRAFTRVLQGHIAIDTAIWPEGTTGFQLDTLARSALWRDGMNYGHGTGHGFGSFLVVHEGPQRLGPSSVPLVPGHTLTNEPGFYKAGAFGIRIESALVVKEVDTRENFGSRKWLGFERFTQVPITLDMVDFSLMSKQETKWLIAHNQECARKVLPLVRKEGDKRAAKWLKKNASLNLWSRLRLAVGF